MNGSATVSENVIKIILDYKWPGNVRELENIMERNVLLATGPVIDSLVLPKDQRKITVTNADLRVRTMEENERDHIIAVLKKCDWKVYGPGGAAELLDINGSTLSSRMIKLGIKKSKGTSE